MRALGTGERLDGRLAAAHEDAEREVQWVADSEERDRLRAAAGRYAAEIRTAAKPLPQG